MGALAALHCTADPRPRLVAAGMLVLAASAFMHGTLTTESGSGDIFLPQPNHGPMRSLSSRLATTHSDLGRSEE